MAGHGRAVLGPLPVELPFERPDAGLHPSHRGGQLSTLRLEVAPVLLLRPGGVPEVRLGGKLGLEVRDLGPQPVPIGREARRPRRRPNPARLQAILRWLPGARERAMEPEFAHGSGTARFSKSSVPVAGAPWLRLRRPRGRALAGLGACRSGRRRPTLPRTAGIDPGEEPPAAVLTDDETTKILRADPETAPAPPANHLDPGLRIGIRPDRRRMARGRGLALGRGDLLSILGAGHRGRGPGFEREGGVRVPGMIGHF